MKVYVVRTCDEEMGMTKCIHGVYSTESAANDARDRILDWAGFDTRVDVEEFEMD